MGGTPGSSLTGGRWSVSGQGTTETGCLWGSSGLGSSISMLGTGMISTDQDIILDNLLNLFGGRRLVVSIRQSRPLTKFEKMWNSPCIAIEDPFELSHNLGAGISRKSENSKLENNFAIGFYNFQ